ncbi:hypothetical protein ASE09_08070 [Streptomyces sp. Root66D1]|nr:hypothetical protein ASD33_08065 [Streptomyces sp. Root1304]KRA90072.1 hypothetical protein ASE09_08070 [Streptomyces sp. Root66D1]
MTLVALLGAGCGPGTATPAFGRTAAHDEIVAAVEGAGLPESALPEIGGPTPSGATPRPTPSTDRERAAERAAACSTGWQYIGPVAEGSRAGFDKAVAALTGKRWNQTQRQVEKLDEKGGTSVSVTLDKQGWTMYARHHSARQGLSMDIISFQASENSCMAKLTDKERESLLGDDGEQP